MRLILLPCLQLVLIHERLRKLDKLLSAGLHLDHRSQLVDQSRGYHHGIQSVHWERDTAILAYTGQRHQHVDVHIYDYLHLDLYAAADFCLRRFGSDLRLRCSYHHHYHTGCSSDSAGHEQNSSPILQSNSLRIWNDGRDYGEQCSSVRQQGHAALHCCTMVFRDVRADKHAELVFDIFDCISRAVVLGLEHVHGFYGCRDACCQCYLGQDELYSLGHMEFLWNDQKRKG